MALELTGERTVPGIAHENYWFRRHEAAYLDLVRHCVGAVVLEAGCGEGYGAALIAGHAARVVALDYDELTAAQITSRLSGLSPAQLRKVRDYEKRNANRKSVLAAVETKLK